MKLLLPVSLLIACMVWTPSPAWPNSEEVKVQRVITEQISDVAVHVDVTTAWATYQDRVIIARHEGTTEYAALCTSTFHKTLTGWVYQHEHCSSYALGNNANNRHNLRLP